MTDLTHTEAQNLLAGGLALSLQNQADLQFHLAGCAECRFYAELHTRLATELPALYSATAVSFVQQPWFLHTFQEAIDRQNMSRNFVKETRFWLGIAVILVIILIVGWAVRTLAPAPQPGQGVANTPSRTETPTITATFHLPDLPTAGNDAGIYRASQHHHTLPGGAARMFAPL
jgi:hypothetical protein